MLYKGFEVRGAGNGLYVGTFHGTPLVGGSSTTDVMNGIDALENMGVVTVTCRTETKVATDFFGLPTCDEDDNEEDAVCEECGVDPVDLDEAEDLRDANEILTATISILNKENARLHTLAKGQAEAVAEAAELSKQAKEEIQALRKQLDSSVCLFDLFNKFLHNPVALANIKNAVQYATLFRDTESVVMAGVYERRVCNLVSRAVKGE